MTGFDLTFAAPKSVSVLYRTWRTSQFGRRFGGTPSGGVGCDRLRRGQGARGSQAEPGPSEQWSRSTEHSALRSCTGRAAPLIRIFTHTWWSRISDAGRDGRFSALDGRGIYAHAGAIGALYHVQLRARVDGRLGVEWGPRPG